MQIDTRSTPFDLSNPSGNVTTTTITVPTATLTLPSGEGVVQMGQFGSVQGSLAPSGLQIIPYGAGLATQTFSLAVYGWREVVAGQGNPPLWVPFILVQFSCTLSTSPGVTGADVNASQLFCDRISLVVGNGNVSNEIVSPGGNVIAHCIVTAKGVRFMQILFGTGGSATSCNALISTL